MSSSETFRVSAASCDRFQHLSMHDLFLHVQEISIRDVEESGITRKETLDSGLLWIVARISARMERPISYDETVTLSTHAGKSRHMLFPRHCEIRDEQGNVLFRSCAIWVLMDQKTRKTIVPEEHGIRIPGEDQPEDLPWLMKVPQVIGETETILHRTSFSELDLNGHVSNLSYYRWIEDLFSEAEHRDQFISSLKISYLHEILLNEEVALNMTSSGNQVRIDGAVQNRPVFEAFLEQKQIRES